MAIKKLITAVAAALGLAAAAPASAIIVGGIDFGSLGATQHLETTTLAETVANAMGQTIQGYGEVNVVNGDATYCADGTANCSLYYYFHDYTVSVFDGAGGKVEFTGGVVDLYYSAAPLANLLNQSSPSNVAFITGLTPWARLTGHTFTDPVFNDATHLGDTYTLNGFGTITGSSLSEHGNGILDSDVGGGFGIASVQEYLNGNSEGDGMGGFGDITLLSESNNSAGRRNPHDGCPNPAVAPPDAGSWCLQGSLSTSGAVSVPEPATLALLGVGLLGLGFTQRKRWS